MLGKDGKNEDGEKKKRKVCREETTLQEVAGLQSGSSGEFESQESEEKATNTNSSKDPPPAASVPSGVAATAPQAPRTPDTKALKDMEATEEANGLKSEDENEKKVRRTNAFKDMADSFIRLKRDASLRPAVQDRAPLFAGIPDQPDVEKLFRKYLQDSGEGDCDDKTTEMVCKFVLQVANDSSRPKINYLL